MYYNERILRPGPLLEGKSATILDLDDSNQFRSYPQLVGHSFKGCALPPSLLFHFLLRNGLPIAARRFPSFLYFYEFQCLCLFQTHGVVGVSGLQSLCKSPLLITANAGFTSKCQTCHLKLAFLILVEGEEERPPTTLSCQGEEPQGSSSGRFS